MSSVVTVILNSWTMQVIVDSMTNQTETVEVTER